MRRLVQLPPTPVGSALNRLYPGRLPASIAEDLANEVAANIPYIIPCDLRQIAAKMGIEVHECESVADGSLAGWPEKPVVRVRRIVGMVHASERRRQLFSIAHELGHVALRRRLSLFFEDVQYVLNDEAEEHVANSFAGALLMPRRGILADLESGGVSPRACISLAEGYNVSLTALLTRIGDFVARGHTFAAILWKSDGRDLEASWATPRRLIDDLPYAPVRSCAVHAWSTNAEAVSSELIPTGDRRRRWECSAARLGGSDLVLMVARRRGCSFQFKAPRALERVIAKHVILPIAHPASQLSLMI